MTKTIYTRIINKKITSVELKSVLGRELYICNNGNWTDVLNEFSFSYTPEQFCQYISDYKAWAELNNVYVEITEGKAEFRQSINEAKDLLKDCLRIMSLMILNHCILVFQQGRRKLSFLFLGTVKSLSTHMRT